MATTIDNIQIEIQSSSTNAAQGINNLAKSLENLKNNGSFKTAINNLNNLRNALRLYNNVPSNASKIISLASALEKLKSIGSVGGIGNSLSKLAGSLKGLDAVDVSSLGPQIQKIVEAVTPLSSVKAGGLSTMVNALSKIGKVTESLDDDTINAFAKKIETLNKKLEPLATKMATIQSGLKGINSASKSAGTGVKQMGDNVDASSLNMSSFIHIIQTAVQAIKSLVTAVSGFVGQAIEWDGIAARFGRGLGPQAKETYEWIQLLNEEMGINIQQFMQYSSVYATMLTGFGVAMEDAGKMALGYTELTYDIWAGYNDIYKNFSDAAEAVKSAIAGEVEPIRRAGFTIVEATLEQTAANYGLEISLEKATEAQKSYLRYLTLIDQAKAQGLVGTYAKELTTAEGLMRTLSQQTKSLSQAFGSLFLPILVQIVPWLQAFVELLTEAIHWLAGLFGITIQGVDWSGYNDGSDAIGGVTDSAAGATEALGSAAAAAKELKNATLGIDELNVISPPSASGGGGGAGDAGTGFEDLDVDSLWDNSIFSEIGNQVDTIKEKLKSWLPIIETIGAILGGLAILNLLTNLGAGLAKLAEMEGKLAALKLQLAGLAILTIEAVLVFKLADEYLESGNLMALIGEALATAAGGYLMYKGFGAKGLVMSLAVSMAAQLAAITLNLADGGVEMDDPQLWIQSAFTAALGGVAGGFLSYKGLIQMSVGKGVALGLLAGLSLTLASITIGSIAADGLTTESFITGLGSVAAGTGLGFMVGGPTGAMIGFGVSLAVNVVGGLIASVSESTKENLEDDLDSRFGNVELSLSEVKVVIDKLSPEWADEVRMATELREDVASRLAEIDRQLGIADGYEWQVSIGLTLTEEENAKYRTTIDNFISACQSYVEERGYALEVGLRATTTDDSIIASANSVSAMASTELAALGKKLQDTVNEAYSDGLLDIPELEVIQNIRNDMQAIVNALNQSDIDAKIDTFHMKWSGIDLDPDSYNTMMSEWNDLIQKDIKPSLEATVTENLKNLRGNIAYLELALEKDPDNEHLKAELAVAEQALQDYLDSNPLSGLTLETNIEAVTFSLNTLRDAFAKEIARVEKAGYLDYETNVEFAVNARPNVKYDAGDGEVYGNWGIIYSDIKYEMEKAGDSLSKQARKNLTDMLESMEPTMADFEKLAAENRKAGVTVVQSVRDGLNDYNELKALSGDVDGINYMIGQGFSTDPVFLNTLATVEDVGYEIQGSLREGLLNNVDYVYDEASGIITGIKNAVTGEVTYITPTLKKNLEDMGVNLGDALGGKYEYVYDSTTGVLQSIVDSVTGNEVWVNAELKAAGKAAGTDLSKGLKSGIDEDKPSLMEKIKGWCDGVIDKIRGVFDTHSPSKKTEAIGKDLSAGLSQGMKTNTLSGRLSELWTNAKTWWDTKKGTLKTYTPSIGSIYDGMKSRWDNARTWWNDKKTKAKEYTPPIGSIYEKVYDRWKNAREWWNGKKAAMKSYTPSIGSITDKVKSAWNSAKSWWSKNAKLSTKLDIKTPTIKVKWDTASAFGKSFKYPTGFSLKFAADGGVFDQGSLVWAGERGPEVVANAAGGKTGVMNVQQMQDAVYEGVYAAVVAAMNAANGNNGSQPVNVYLDGKQITATVERRQRERGASILGNQVYAY